MKEEEIKKNIAEILRANIHYSPQLENYVIHGAIEAIWKLMQESHPAPKQELVKIIKQGEKVCDCPECGAEIKNGLSGEVLKLFRDSKLFKPQQVEQQENISMQGNFKKEQVYPMPPLSDEEVADEKYVDEVFTLGLNNLIEALEKIEQIASAALKNITHTPESEAAQLSKNKPVQEDKWRIKEDNICPATGEQCDDECCPVGAICNLHSGEIQNISKPPQVAQLKNKPVEEDKISDEEIEKLAEKELGTLPYETDRERDACEFGFFKGFKACLQKGSEDKTDINEVSILKHIRQQLIEKDAEIERLRLSEDKIQKGNEFNDKI